MQKNVYLFELDSVITSPRECLKAQEKLFMELMHGNVVVLSHNQILSIIMFDLLDINQAKYTRDHILNLIKKRRICVSIYNDKETPGDYISSKMNPNADMFKFSCMRFLNDLKDNPNAFSDIQKAFEGKKAWKSWRDIKIDALNNDNKKLLYEYIFVMQELARHLHTFDPIKHELHDLEFYLRTVTSAVLSAGDHYLGYIPNLTTKAAENIEKMIEMVHNDGKNVYRSVCLDAIHKIKDSDKASINLCKAILDMSYNYQVERSISNITITHAMDNQSIAKTVVKYYHEHDFSDSKSIALPKNNKVLAWEIVDDFSNEYKKAKKTIVDSRTPIKKFLAKSLIKTLLGFAVIILSFFLGNHIEALMTWAKKLLLLAVLGIWLVSEYINWIMPTSVYDGFASIVKLSRYFQAYTNFKKGFPYYVKINLKERICEKFKREEKDDGIF